MLNLPSFFLGYVSGAATVLLMRRFSPVLSDLATAGYDLADSMSAMLAARLEDIEDLLAEARARADSERADANPPRQAPVLRAVPKTAKKTRRKSTRKKAPVRRRKTA